jgi:hypothetical protein
MRDMKRHILTTTILSATLLLAAARHADAASFNLTTGTDSTTKTLNAGETGTVAAGATLTVNAGTNTITLGATTGTTTITNNGSILQTGTGRTIRNNTSGTPSFQITNNSTGTISSASGDTIRADVATSNWTINNTGIITSLNSALAGNQAIDFDAITTGTVSITNNAGGQILAYAADAIRPGANATVINAGLISATLNPADLAPSSDGLDAQQRSGVNITNTGTISGRHGITGGDALLSTFAITVTNNTGGLITGVNGSGVNIDGVFATAGANVTNVLGATIRGGVGATFANGDGDGVDVDGVLTLNNSGNIFGYGAKGLGSDGGQNNAEAVSIGGGSITNTATGQIIGSTLLADAANGDSSRAGNGILVDNSSGGNAVAATTVTNSGLIQGKTGNAIKMVGTFANTVTNNAGGTIRGAGTGAAIQTGNGNDIINNAGTITGDNGLAVDMQGGNDTLNIQGGVASITGSIDGGTGTNTLNITLGVGNTFTYAGTITNFNTSVQSGTLNGNITLNGGTFKNDGGIVTGTVTVNGGTVTGTNLSGVTLNIGAGATLSPGNSPGTLSTGSETWAGGGSYLWEINRLLADGGAQGADPGWDFADITGSLTITANSGNKFNINLDSLALLSSWDNSQSYSFNLATASGGIFGFDASDFLINTSAFDDLHSLGVGHFYVEQDGNSLELNFTPVPEPATIGIGIALMGVAFIRRRRGA